MELESPFSLSLCLPFTLYQEPPTWPKRKRRESEQGKLAMPQTHHQEGKRATPTSKKNSLAVPRMMRLQTTSQITVPLTFLIASLPRVRGKLKEYFKGNSSACYSAADRTLPRRYWKRIAYWLLPRAATAEQLLASS
jgi:hypothetical protein